jgi:hypothetical protein
MVILQQIGHWTASGLLNADGLIHESIHFIIDAQKKLEISYSQPTFLAIQILARKVL